MTSKPVLLQPEPPEWPRTARFLLIALGLHAVVLFYPLQFGTSQLETPPANAVMVRLIDAVSPVPIAPPPVQAQPAPPKPNVARQQPTPAARPVLAMAPEQTSSPTTFSLPAAAPAPAPVTNATPVAAAASTFTAARFDVAYLGNPEARYPTLSRRMGEEGKVLLKVRVSSEGLPMTVDLEKSSNFERLDEAARSAVTRWRFIPAKRGNEAVEASVIVPIVFRLEG